MIASDRFTCAHVNAFGISPFHRGTRSVLALFRDSIDLER